jgi:hypothetical protein
MSSNPFARQLYYYSKRKHLRYISEIYTNKPILSIQAYKKLEKIKNNINNEPSKPIYFSDNIEKFKIDDIK